MYLHQLHTWCPLWTFSPHTMTERNSVAQAWQLNTFDACLADVNKSIVEAEPIEIYAMLHQWVLFM